MTIQQDYTTIKQQITNLYGTYLSDKSYVFGAFQDLVIIYKMCEDTETTEKENYDKYLKSEKITTNKISTDFFYNNNSFRATHLEFIIAFNKFNPNITHDINCLTEDYIENYYQKYIIKNILYCNNLYKGISTPAIKYFKFIEHAFFENLHKYIIDYTGPYTPSYNNGRPMTTCEYINGKPHGYYIKYTTMTQLQCIVYYNYGLKEGIETIYNVQTQKIFRINNYKNGVKDGKCIEYQKNGNILYEYEYLNGKKHGLCTTYYLNGKIKNQIEYKNDVYDGMYISYFINGNVAVKCNYMNNVFSGDYICCYPNGNIKSRNTYIIIPSDAKYKSKFTDKYVAVINGKHEIYYNDGLLKLECNYENGKQHGILNLYYCNGNIQCTINYYNGLKHGIFIEYYQNNKIKTIINFNHGILQGLYQEFDEDGRYTIMCEYNDNYIVNVIYGDINYDNKKNDLYIEIDKINSENTENNFNKTFDDTNDIKIILDNDDISEEYSDKDDIIQSRKKLKVY
jgi:antitoxin component YwqK of YwqJK toxin-antitoxin module